MSKYHECFGDRQDLIREFHLSEADVPPDEDIIVAVYDQPPYEGQAFVLFAVGDKLFEVHGSHCSCYGLEEQWGPEETTVEALQMRTDAWYFAYLAPFLEHPYDDA